MKLSEIKPCAKCNGPIVPMIYKVTLNRLFVLADVVNREMGMVNMMGGNIGLAGIMGVNEDVTKEVDEFEIIMCQECFMTSYMSDVIPD